jgi:hypothetical protein
MPAKALAKEESRRILIPASNKYNYLASGSDILYFYNAPL